MKCSIRQVKLEGGKRGIAALELALILPVLMILAFGIIDFGRLIHARLIITNVSREGGSLASRDINSGNDLLTMLQVSGSPLDLKGSGKIYISQITAGATAGAPKPVSASQIYGGSLAIGSSIGNGQSNLGLSGEIYNHLVFKPANKTSDISGVTVVEVYYKYLPVTPLPNFIANILVGDGGGKIISSKSVF